MTFHIIENYLHLLLGNNQRTKTIFLSPKFLFLLVHPVVSLSLGIYIENINVLEIYRRECQSLGLYRGKLKTKVSTLSVSGNITFMLLAYFSLTIDNLVVLVCSAVFRQVFSLSRNYLI